MKHLLFTAGFIIAASASHHLKAATVGTPDQQHVATERWLELIQKTIKGGVGKEFKPGDKVEMVAGGFSKADLFRVRAGGGDYIIKIMKDSPQADIQTESVATELAGDVGVGPIFHYANIKDKVILRDAVDNKHSIDRHDTSFHSMVAKKVRAFHESGRLNRDTKFFKILRQDAQRLVDNNMISTFLTPQDEALFLEQAKEVEALFSAFPEDIRPVHHDLSPHNLLYDGKEVWLIDWETASNDFYSIDLCMFANFHVYDESKMMAYLTAYYGRTPTKLELAKFHAIRPFCYGFHGYRLAFLSNMQTMPSLGYVPEYKDFQLGIRKGSIELGSPLSLYKLGVSTMSKAVAMLNGKDYKESIAYIKQHIASVKTKA